MKLTVKADEERKVVSRGNKMEDILIICHWCIKIGNEYVSGKESGINDEKLIQSYGSTNISSFVRRFGKS